MPPGSPRLRSNRLRLDRDDQRKSLNLFLYVAKILFPDQVDWPQVEPPARKS